MTVIYNSNDMSTIVDRGRGPEIRGTRITVYDVLDYRELGWNHIRIAALFQVSSQEVLDAISYIQENKTAIMAEYKAIVERSERGNGPELQERLDTAHEKFLRMVGEREKRNGH